MPEKGNSYNSESSEELKNPDNDSCQSSEQNSDDSDEEGNGSENEEEKETKPNWIRDVTLGVLAVVVFYFGLYLVIYYATNSSGEETGGKIIKNRIGIFFPSFFSWF